MQSSTPTNGPPSLTRLLLREVFAVALTVVALTSPWVYRLRHPAFSLTALVVFGISLIAVLVFLVAFISHTEKQIKSGIATGLWPQAEVDHIRSILDSRWATFLSGALACGAIAGWILSLATSHRLAGVLGSLALMLSGFTNSLKTALTPAKPTYLPSIWNWRTWRNITSDHWGER
jgi:uncharacterized membrane protein